MPCRESQSEKGVSGRTGVSSMNKTLSEMDPKRWEILWLQDGSVHR